ncbi:IS66 family transposase [Paraburkholderia aspalathi]|uniref:IS66 C-terminal element n=1 Tax=Paraburkholderia aspalathi TaxID=1324617 RepID=A0A1I7CLQ0_9BURK|nr:transposase [Paraburkholderia aspalathi]SFU00352.1 IS66 C-terminal element [Paraburkholderia aspalathi]
MPFVTIGIDLAKNVFAVHGVDEYGICPNSQVAGQSMPYFAALYDIEHDAAVLDAESATGSAGAGPIRCATHFYEWTVAQRKLVSEGSAIAKALDYSLKRWEALTHYLDDGHVPIEDNLENRIRPWAIGRASWLFSDTVAGAKASAMIYSLVLTCRACNVEPYAYLLHVFTELPKRPPNADITDLLPFNFSPSTP